MNGVRDEHRRRAAGALHRGKCGKWGKPLAQKRSVSANGDGESGASGATNGLPEPSSAPRASPPLASTNSAASLAGASSGLRGSSSSAHSAHSARNRAAEVEACASSNDDAMARSERGGLSESALLSELRKDARSTEGGAFPEGDSPSVSVEFTAPAIATGAPPCRLEASSPEGRGARARAMRGAECVSCRVLRSRSSEGPVKNFGRRPIARV